MTPEQKRILALEAGISELARLLHEQYHKPVVIGRKWEDCAFVLCKHVQRVLKEGDK